MDLTLKDLNNHQQPKVSTDVKCVLTSEALILSMHVNNSGKEAL